MIGFSLSLHSLLRLEEMRMGFLRLSTIFWIVSICFDVKITAMDNLRVAFQWKQLDFRYPTENDRRSAIEREDFVPENNLPLGLEVYKDRLFITVPRWKKGVAASLAYIKLTDPMDSPKLNPYPNWAAHNFSIPSNPEIISPFRIRADQCDRLWVLDTGVSDILPERKQFTNPQLIIYDLHSDVLLRRYEIPADQLKENVSFFANIAVEDDDCADTYAYLADLAAPSLVVYSFKDNESWKITHNYFHIDPLSGEMSVNGISFEWTDGIFGLALSKRGPDGFSTLYFHPMTSTNEFSVSTKFLRDKNALKNDNYYEFKLLGSRGKKSQSGVSFLDKNSGVLFYTLLNLNAIACWKISNPSYTMQSQGRIYMSNITMVFPNDLKVDSEGNVWALSDKLPVFLYDKLDENVINFRVLTASVKEAIRGTTCDEKLKITNDVSGRKIQIGERSTGNCQESRLLLLALVILGCFCKILY